MTDSQKDFRKALGKFATGVTVITTVDADGGPIGVTASSFNSVSLDPPLVLWSLAKDSYSMQAFEQASGFNVHVLTHQQAAISNHFASKGNDKFAGLDWADSHSPYPVIADYAALFRCTTEFKYEGGDHVIFVGRVTSHEARDAEPLIFRGGQYADVMEKPPTDDTPAIDLDSGMFSKNFLLYLLARAHYQSFHPVRARFIADGLSDSEYFCLSLLSGRETLSRETVIARLAHTGFAPDAEIFARLLRKGLIDETDAGINLSEAGHAQFRDLLGHADKVQAEIGEALSDIELTQLRSLLTKLVAVTGRDIPDLWGA